MVLAGVGALLALSSVVAIADGSQRGQGAYDKRDPDSYDYNVPLALALPPYGYLPSFWGYGRRRYYDRFGNYKKYGQEPGEPDTGPGQVASRPLL